jgi:putative nucleotidyltransferase with HDIG domain
MIGVTEDVTEMEVSRRRLVTSARALNALSYCNQTLARASDEEGLLADVCKVGVEQGGYRTVWVGYPQDDEDKTVKPMAFAGHEEGFLQAADFNWGDTDPERNGPPGLAIRTKEPIVLQDLQEDSRFRAFAKQASLGNYGGSVAAFPLIDSGQHAIGAIMFVRGRRGGFETEELALLDALATDLAYGIEALRTRSLRDRFAADLFATNQRLQEVLRQTVEAMSRIVETRDPYTQGHQVRVDGLARAIAQELGIGESEIDGIETAALVHDIGKLAVPTEILTKPTQLTELEFTLIKEHPQAGYEILKDIDFLWPVAEMVLQHHERMDGSGYPRGLKGPEILRGARIIAVADVVEAMASHRPYRPALGIEAALAEISDLSRFDPEVVAACTILFRSGRFSLEQ